MGSEVVQLGPLEMSKAVFDGLFLLGGVVVGGLITYFTTRALENKKWDQQKKDRLQEQRREALGLALEWIPPIEIALTEASLAASRFLKNELSTNDFLKRWPDLLSRLAKRDLPMKLNILLPSSIVSQSYEIVKQLEDLQSFALASKSLSKLRKDEWMKRFHSFSEQVASVSNNFEALKQDLKSEYEKTFT
jgi:hypothetical protein